MMNCQITKEQLSSAIKYFNSLVLQKIDLKLFEQNLNILESFVSDQQFCVNTPSAIFEIIFTALVTKYYQIFTQKHRVINEQYLQNKLVTVFKILYQKHMKKSKLSKDIFAFCLFTNSKKLKQQIAENPKNNDTAISLLNFSLSLLIEITQTNEFKVKQFYPNLMSLCSNCLRAQNLSLKPFQLILEKMKILIKSNQFFLISKQNDISFQQQSHKRLNDDVQYLINKYSNLQSSFRLKITAFSQFLIDFYKLNQLNNQRQLKNLQDLLNNQPIQLNNYKMKLFSSIILFGQINEISIDINSYPFLERQTIKQLYKQLFISSCSKILKTQVNNQVKKQQISKLTYLIKFIEIKQADGEQLSNYLLKFVNHIFNIRKNHCLITIPHHSCTIPLENLNQNHTRQNYSTKFIDVEYKKEFNRMVTQIIPFYQLQTSLVEMVQTFFANIPNNNRLCLLRTFNDSLIQCEYQLDMSLTKLYTYLSLLLSLKYIIVTAPISFQWYNLAYSVFQTLASKTQSVKSLRASYVQEQLLISATIEIISHTYRYLKRYYLPQSNIPSKVKLTQATILLIQKILNSLTQSSYLIRLVTTDSLLNYAQDRTICHALESFNAALIHRNRNNWELILNILSITSLNQADYEELAQFYMNYQGSELILRNLLPKISIQKCRMCLLTVQKWWLLFNRQLIDHLNCKEMKTNNQKLQNFYVKDGQNVVIKNALGVIILQMADKWTFQLRSQKKQLVIDIILQLSKVNPNMVFFRSFFNNLMKELNSIIKQCLGYEQQQTAITCKKRKNKQSEKKSTIIPKKVEFYDRMRLKIYQIFANLPKDSYLIFDKDTKQTLKSILEPQHDQVKRDYLFNNNLDLKAQYQLGKKVMELLE